MFEIKVTVDPALIASLNALADALGNKARGEIMQNNTPTAPVIPAPTRSTVVTPPMTAPVTPPAPVPMAPAAPVTPAAPVAPTPAAAVPTAPVAPAPVPTAPVAPVVPTGAPTYTLEQIAAAGTALVDAGKMDALLALLGRYGVDSITKIKPEQYGAFATDLRTLGAQI